MIKNKRKLVIIILVFIFLIFIQNAFAKDAKQDEKSNIYFIPQISIGDEITLGEKREITGKSFAEYIAAIYNWSIRVIVFLAIIVIMFNGVNWMMAGGNASSITKAKDSITAALIGMLIGLVSYFLLNFINPSLVRLKDLKISSVEKIAGCVDCRLGGICVFKGFDGPTYDSDWYDRIKQGECVTYSLEIWTQVLPVKAKELTFKILPNKNCGKMVHNDGINPTIGGYCSPAQVCAIESGIYSQEHPKLIILFDLFLKYKHAECVNRQSISVEIDTESPENCYLFSENNCRLPCWWDIISKTCLSYKTSGVCRDPNSLKPARCCGKGKLLKTSYGDCNLCGEDWFLVDDRSCDQMTQP